MNHFFQDLLLGLPIRRIDIDKIKPNDIQLTDVLVNTLIKGHAYSLSDRTNFIFPQRQHGSILQPIFNTMIDYQKKPIPSSVKQIIEDVINTHKQDKNGIVFDPKVLRKIQETIKQEFRPDELKTEEARAKLPGRCK